jgi:flagellar basal-body rod protein FlgC
MFSSLDISTSALVAQRINLNTIAGNVANMHSNRDAQGQPNPYRRRVALFAPGNPSAGPHAPGVHVQDIVESPEPFRLEYQPEHPDAIKTGERQGYVRMPNVHYSTEMINAMMASRIYEANVTVMEVTKTMAAASLRLLA